MKYSVREIQQKRVNGKECQMFILEHDFFNFFIPSKILNLAILTPEDLVFESEITLKTKCIDRKISNTP